MLCQQCNKNVAVVLTTEIEEDWKYKESHLCGDCAADGGLPVFKAPSLADLIGLGLLEVAKTGRKEADVECPACGTTLRDFRTKGRLGCPRDYEVFRVPLETLLEKVHGGKRHVGRGPAKGAPPPEKGKTPRKAADEADVEALRKRLAQAVRNEKYEEAARLRDKIGQIERGEKEQSEERRA